MATPAEMLWREPINEGRATSPSTISYEDLKQPSVPDERWSRFTVSLYWSTLKSNATDVRSHPAAPKPDSVEFSWTQRAIELGRNAHELEHLALVLKELDDEMYAGNFEILGSAIAVLPLNELSPQVLLAIVRGLAPAREKISSWTRTVEGVRRELDARGLDAARLLRGID
jgi:hypothetical protein